ncbi:MAG TPA: Sir2 silent information regulator family NAD-dependent deacetylase [Candidatus Faecimonas intestinavium]|nr:Sir2 silent information regulator family NAD-dependent deacetylase [Candidatus Faecimonas intestinavium]
MMKAKEKIKNADYIIIGAGSGLSTAAGLEYNGESFEKNYKEFIKKYHFQDLYSASFYPFSSQEEKWAFWARLVKLNRLNKPLKLYQELLETMKEKEYFVLTTNVDGQFEIAGFNNDKIFAIQGDYSFIQCEEGCHDKLYNNKNMVEEWIKNTKNCKIPKDLVPKCPVCGKNMEMNLRKDANFVQDEKWYIQAKRYEEFLEKAKSKKLLLLEIGVGFNTPGIIRLPFEQMTYHNLRTSLIRINKDYPFASHEIENRMISFNEDTNRIIEDLKEK